MTKHIDNILAKLKGIADGSPFLLSGGSTVTPVNETSSYIEIFNLFNDSILSGEYYLPVFKDKIIEVREAIDALYENTISSSEDLSSPTLIKKVEYIKEAKDFADIYYDFFRYINRFTLVYLPYHKGDHIGPNSTILFENVITSFSTTEIKNFIEKKINSPANKHDKHKNYSHLFFQINLFLALIDFDLNCTQNKIIDLIEIRELLAKNLKTQDFPITKILEDKCNILLLKTAHKIKGTFYYITSNRAEYEINYKWVRKKIGEYFEKVQDGTEQPSEYQKFIDLFSEFILKNNEVYNGEVISSDAKTCVDLYRKFKEIKKNYLGEERIAQIKGLLDALENVETFTNIPFDDISKRTFKIHFERWIFFTRIELISKQIINADINLIEGQRKIEDELNSIINLSERNNIFDAKVYEIYISTCLTIADHMDKHIDNIKLLDLIDFNSHVLNCFEKYANCLKWMHDIDYIPLLLPHKECQIENSGFFLDSSFFRPQNIDKIDSTRAKQYDEFRKKRIALVAKVVYDESLRETKRHLENSTENLKKTKQSLRSDIDKTQIKNIEVLSIFTAAIALIISAVVVSNKELEWHQVIYWMIGLTFCLTTFVILVHYIVSNKFKWGVFVVFALLFFFFLCIAMDFNK